jgi:molecular chaperone Hsp33
MEQFMDDVLVRALAKEAGVRVLLGATTGLSAEAARRHEAAPTAAVALARALTGAALLGATLKVQQRIALKFEGGGPLGKILAESDAYGRVRGYVSNPQTNLPTRLDGHDVATALGVGVLTVVKDLRAKKLYESSVPLLSGEIDADLTYYLGQSEQIPSLVTAGAELDEAGNVSCAGGLLLQAIPPYEQTDIRYLVERLAEMPPVVNMLAAGRTPGDILADLFGEMAYTVLEERPLSFHCGCSWERTRQALLMLGREEIAEMLAADGQAEVACHFCHEQYHFNRADLEEMLGEK